MHLKSKTVNLPGPLLRCRFWCCVAPSVAKFGKLALSLPVIYKARKGHREVISRSQWANQQVKTEVIISSKRGQQQVKMKPSACRSQQGHKRCCSASWIALKELSTDRSSLKVPKREIFVTELIILSHPIWIGDLRTKAKNRFVRMVRLLLAILVFYRWLSVR